MNWKQYLDEHQNRVVQELLAFIRIPSVSAVAAHTDHVAEAASWVHNRMEAAGIEHVQTLPTGVNPVVYGDWLHQSGAPTVLIYGHFDVQPAKINDGWENQPFDPHITNGRIYGRGSSDDKGNMFAPIVALEALLSTMGSLPINVKFLFEGQEEIGSPKLDVFIDAHRDLLSCDLSLSADGNQWSEQQPALQLSLRGICALEISVKGPSVDLHSGTYGGTIHNPLHAIAELISGLHDSEGRVAVEGFYDHVTEPSIQQRSEFDRIPFDKSSYLEETGSPKLYGETGWSTYERQWIRPTLEINGIWGGFQEAGSKTVIPTTAHAKITCRLVANQRPEKIIKLVITHLQNSTPNSVQLKCQPSDVYGAPYKVPADHPGNLAVASVLKHLYGVEPLRIGTGGSIPVCGLLLEKLGVHTIGFSFALDDEGAHGPNEFFRLSNFRRAQEGYCLIMQELATR